MKKLIGCFFLLIYVITCNGNISLSDVKGKTTTDRIHNLNKSLKNKCHYIYEHRDTKFQSDVDGIIDQMIDVFNNEGIVRIVDEYRQLLIEAYLYRIKNCKGSIEDKYSDILAAYDCIVNSKQVKKIQSTTGVIDTQYRNNNYNENYNYNNNNNDYSRRDNRQTSFSISRNVIVINRRLYNLYHPEINKQIVKILEELVVKNPKEALIYCMDNISTGAITKPNAAEIYSLVTKSVRKKIASKEYKEALDVCRIIDDNLDTPNRDIIFSPSFTDNKVYIALLYDRLGQKNIAIDSYRYLLNNQSVLHIDKKTIDGISKRLNKLQAPEQVHPVK